MKDPYELKVNLADPESIKAKVPEMVRVVEEKRRAAREAEEEFKTWESLLQKLRSLAGLILHFEDPDESSTGFSPTALDAVLHIVEKEDRPIMPIGVTNALRDEGHEVDSKEAVMAALSALVAAGRLQQIEERTFAPISFDASFLAEMPVAVPIPEAHFGLNGPDPQSKAEAAIRVLASDPERAWSTPAVGDVMIAQGWMTDSDGDLASLASTLSRLVAERKIFRPLRGRYQLVPPAQEAD